MGEENAKDGAKAKGRGVTGHVAGKGRLPHNAKITGLPPVTLITISARTATPCAFFCYAVFAMTGELKKWKKGASENGYGEPGIILIDGDMDRVLSVTKQEDRSDSVHGRVRWMFSLEVQQGGCTGCC